MKRVLLFLCIGLFSVESLAMVQRRKIYELSFTQMDKLPYEYYLTMVNLSTQEARDYHTKRYKEHASKNAFKKDVKIASISFGSAVVATAFVLSCVQRNRLDLLYKIPLSAGALYGVIKISIALYDYLIEGRNTQKSIQKWFTDKIDKSKKSK